MKNPNRLSSASIELPIIGYIRSPLSQKFGIPRQPNLVQIPAVIEFVSPFDTAAAFDGVENFSHLWVIWQFHHNKAQDSFKSQVRPPRLGGNQKIGVFATRSMYRPANIGLSVVKLEQVEQLQNSVRLHVSGADMVDGTPILDIKPYIPYSDSISEARSGFANNEPIQKVVKLSAEFEQQFAEFLLQSTKNSLSKKSLYQPNLMLQDLALIEKLIAQDPRPAYRQTEVETIFFMRYKEFDIGFFMDIDKVLVINNIVKVH